MSFSIWVSEGPTRFADPCVLTGTVDFLATGAGLAAGVRLAETRERSQKGKSGKRAMKSQIEFPVWRSKTYDEDLCSK